MALGELVCENEGSDRGPDGRLVPRGHGDSVDAGREPGKVASRPHDLVFRAVRPRRDRPGGTAASPRLRVSLQLVLRRGRRSSSAQPPRDAVASFCPRNLRLSSLGRRAHALRFGAWPFAGDCRANRAWVAPRDAAPGALAYRHQARALSKPDAPGLCEGPRAAPRERTGSALRFCSRMGGSSTSAPPPMASRSTTSVHGTGPGSTHFRSARGSSRRPSTAPSSSIVATSDPSSGSRTGFAWFKTAP